MIFTILTIALIPGQPQAAPWAITERASPWVVTEKAKPLPNPCGMIACPCGCQQGKACLCKYYSAMAESRRTGKPVLVVFRSDPCSWCDKLERGPLVELDAWIGERFHVAHLDAGEISQSVGVTRFPTMLVCKGDGTILRRFEGYADAGTLKVWLEPRTTSSVREYVTTQAVCVGGR